MISVTHHHTSPLFRQSLRQPFFHFPRCRLHRTTTDHSLRRDTYSCTDPAPPHHRPVVQRRVAESRLTNGTAVGFILVPIIVTCLLAWSLVVSSRCGDYRLPSSYLPTFLDLHQDKEIDVIHFPTTHPLLPSIVASRFLCPSPSLTGLAPHHPLALHLLITFLSQLPPSITPTQLCCPVPLQQPDLCSTHTDLSPSAPCPR